jgi:dTDP-4-dehydrorhamnose reductase
MRVLIAGREGQVARALLARLPRDGHEVIALDLPEFDLMDRASIARTMDSAPDAVVNAAAYTAVDRAEDEPAIAHAINAAGAGWLAAEAADRGARFLHFSTDYVFDGRKGAPYTEDDQPHPLGVYGATKLAGERLVMAAHPGATILRTAWVCSPDGANFVKTILRLGCERGAVRVVADQHGAPTFADDLADATARLLHRDAPGLFHFTSAPHTTWHGFAEVIFDSAARRGRRRPALAAIATHEFRTRAKRPADGRLDCTRIARLHGIVAPDWRASLERCLDTLLGPVKEEQS